MPNNPSTYCKLLVVNRIGGGREDFARSSQVAGSTSVAAGSSSVVACRAIIAADYCSRKSSRRLFLCLLVCALALVCTSCRRGATVCGVPYSGATPWELAAAIHDRGDQTFVPLTVYQYPNKAYISGFLLPDEIPAHIVCDLQDGHVTMAVLYNSTVDTSE